jgi:carbon-monoxide dehydrogenase large subunit
LPAVVDIEAALAEGAPLASSRARTSRYVWLESGDYEAAKAKADVVVARRYIQRLIPNAMEPRSVVAASAAGTGELTLWSATQIRTSCLLLSLVTGIAENKIRVVAPDVGGFGSKLQFYPEK